MDKYKRRRNTKTERIHKNIAYTHQQTTLSEWNNNHKQKMNILKGHDTILQKYIPWTQPNWIEKDTNTNRGLWITIKSGGAILRGNTKGKPLDSKDENTYPMCKKKRKRNRNSYHNTLPKIQTAKKNSMEQNENNNTTDYK